MKSIFKSMSCLILGAMIVTPMFAQQKKLYPELEGPGPVVIISKDKNGKEELINVFEETQRPHFHDPRAPRFLLTDQQGKFALGIGGYLKTTMEYDFNGIVDDVDFIPAGRHYKKGKTHRKNNTPAGFALQGSFLWGEAITALPACAQYRLSVS